MVCSNYFPRIRKDFFIKELLGNTKKKIKSKKI
jgi:hypothetical protein